MANYFSLILTVVTIVSGLLWLYDAKFLKPKRQAIVAEVEKKTTSPLTEEQVEQLAPQPKLMELGQSIFPVIALVLVVRTLLYEPFQIPSGSMMPTLLRGDFILVQKFDYGIKEPLFQNTVIETTEPERGDIAVFKYPEEPSIDYIKRVVGLPGDRIIYRNKTLYIQPACEEGRRDCPEMAVIRTQLKDDGAYFSGSSPLKTYEERLGDVKHDILVDPRVASRRAFFYDQPGTQRDEWVVPEGQYFVMGDNRDNSRDSRYWGFVDETLLVGKAVFIWMSFEMDRGQDSWLPSWVPTGIRFERLGSIE
ncbi:signal peptidase I [Idiomarina sp. X4]|uniref:signal peptidase I n=1 Tax=Idiomarina sp. X4 TaxID=2055892 RepID=UPI000C2840D4|nr:signal peptidase I [Idiomarina sp. X4]ATZ72218.1 signal peptidase I [Idiomarina sp. X4]